MSSPPVILICPRPASEEAEELGLPSDSDNIFQRLIRNPHLESDTPRERECTEMFCSVLCNAPMLRARLLQWFGGLGSPLPGDFEELDYYVDTEGSIGAKRDDLRIEGWRQTEERQELVVLWSVEVKVGAPFHESSLQESSEATDVETSDTAEIVNQLENYDRWLRKQPVECRAGFVLALSDMTNAVPAGLVMPWHCITWTQIGQQVHDVLKEDVLPPAEEFLARHLLGFIRRHLWRTSEMSNDRIEFDDIALVRAFAQIGVDCDKKINRIVGLLQSILEDVAIGCGKIWQSDSFFRAYRRAVAFRLVFDKAVSAYPVIMLGIEEDNLAVWLETPPGNEKKIPFNEVLQSLLPALHDHNPEWRVPSLDDRTWKDIELRSPLIDLLVAEDQEAAFTAFFRKALADLNECCVVAALRERL